MGQLSYPQAGGDPGAGATSIVPSASGTAAPRAATVELDGAVFAFDGGGAAVSADLRLAVDGMVGIVGPSGAGKTTLLRALLGQVHPVRGEVRVRRPGGGGGRLRMAYVPQLETVDWQFPITVSETVLLGRATESGPLPWPRRRDRADMEAWLDRFRIASLRDRHIRSLSGGELQRVFLARALMRRPELLLLDEPTSGLDVNTRQQILDVLAELHGGGIGIVLTTHDLNGVATTLPDLVCLNRRVVAHGPPEQVLTPEVLRATFGSDMVVFRHDGMLLTADAPAHGPSHAHHVHLHHGPPHSDTDPAASEP